MSSLLFLNRDTDAQAVRSWVNQILATDRDDPTNQDLTRLFATSVIAYRAGKKRADAVAAVPMVIKDRAGDPLPKNDPLVQALLRDYKDNMRRSELTLCFWGGNLLWKRRAYNGMPYKLRWVNPTLWRVMYGTKGLKGFTVANSAKTSHIPVREIKPSDAVYMHEMSFDNDFKGVAPIQVAFRHAQLGVEIVETQVAFMQNRAIPAAIVQPADEKVQAPDEKERDRLQKMLQNIYMGAKNAGRTLIQRFRFEWIQLQSNFDDVEFQTHYEQAYEAVAIAFDVPVSLIRESASNFAQQREVRLDWAQSWLVPRVEWYGEQYTTQLAEDSDVVKRYGTGLTVTPDTVNVALLKEDEKGKLERINMKVQAGYKDMYTAAVEGGEKDPPEKLKGKYMWNGVPTPIEQIDTLWQAKLPPPAPPAPAPAAPPVLAPVEPNQLPAGVVPADDKTAPSGKKAHIILTLPNNGDLIALQSRLKELCTGMNIPVRWLAPDSFHVTLVSIPNASDQQIGIMKAALEGFTGDDLSMRIGQLNVFDTIGEHAIHFKIRKNLALQDAQGDLWNLCSSYGIGMVGHSHPDKYDAHVTMGFASQKLHLIPFNNRIAVEPDEVQLCVGDDHEIVYRRKWMEDPEQPTPPDKPEPTLPTPAKTFLPDDVFGELKVAARKGGAFVADKLPPSTVTYIKALKELGFNQDTILDTAKSFTLSVLAAKSVSATQMEFEREFDGLMEAARSSEKNRKQVGGKLRYFVNQFVDRAFMDGLIDGGIEDAVMTDEDRSVATQFKSAASTFLTTFLDTLYKGEGISDDQAVYKATQWWNGTIYPAYLAGLERAAADSMFTWVLGKTEKHCNSCIALDGQRHRLSEFKAAGLLPKANKLICGRGNLCDCDIVIGKGRAKGRLDTVPVAARSINLLDLNDEQIEDLQGELEAERV